MDVFDYPIRSIQQHNTEWMYYQLISDFTGHSAYEIYEQIASEVLKVVCEDGEIGYIRPTSLNTLHHNQYLERIRQFGAELGIILPDPDKCRDLKHRYKKKISEQ